MSKKLHYIDNKRFEQVIVLYLEDRQAHEDELMGLFDLLIGNIIDSFRFNIEKDDAKQECFLLVLKTLKKFKPSKGSAFNYFTTIIVNNLRLLYTKNKKYDQKISDYTQSLIDQMPKAL